MEKVENIQKCGIDIAKFLCAILVVCIHTHPLQYGTTIDYYFNCFCRIAVPFFFVSSSYFYFTRGGDIKKYIRRLLILYACWFVVEIPFTLKVYFFDASNSLLFNTLKFVRGILINNSFFASWFLTALMEGMFIIHLLEKKKPTLLYVIGSLCFSLALIWCLWYGLIRGTRIESYYNYFGFVFMPANSFVIAIPYLIIGKLFAEKRIPEINYFLCVIFVLVAVVEVCICKYSFNKPFDDVYISLIPLSIIIFQFASKISVSKTSSLNSVCRFLRKCSILIYLLHPVFIYIFEQFGLFQAQGDYNPLVLFLTVLVCSVLCSSMIIALSKRYNLLKYMY